MSLYYVRPILIDTEKKLRNRDKYFEEISTFLGKFTVSGSKHISNPY